MRMGVSPASLTGRNRLRVSVRGRYGIKVKLGTIAPVVMKLESLPWEVPEGPFFLRPKFNGFSRADE